MGTEPYDGFGVLFLCTGNSARSLMAESLLGTRGAGRFRAYSAGSRPTGVAHPIALQTLSEEGHDIRRLWSKSWREFEASKGPPIDLVLTLCDSAKAETCPLFNRDPPRLHWGFPDPAAATDADAPLRFREVYRELAWRIDAMAKLFLDSARTGEWCAELEAIAP